MSEATLKYFELFLQIITAATSVFLAWKRKEKFIVLLAILLLISALVEMTGEYRAFHKKSVFMLYFIYSFFQFNIILLMYYEIIKEKIKMFGFLALAFIIFFIVVFSRNELFPYLIILGSFNTSIFVFLYLKKLLLSDEILNFKRLLPFWVSVGFLVFYLPSIPFFSMLNYMRTRGLFFILHLLIILMNLFIIYGLLCSRKGEEY